MKKAYLASIALLVVLQGCASSTAPSSVGLYGVTPGPVSGSNVQAVSTRTVSYNASDTAEAITKSFNLMGLDFESKDTKRGVYTGRGNWLAPGQATPCSTPYTFAAFVVPVDNKPTTRLTVLIDRHSFCGAALNPEQGLMQQIMSNFAKVLMTF